MNGATIAPSGASPDSSRACFQNSVAKGTSIAPVRPGGFMKETDTTNLDAERAQPRGDTGDGDGVPEGEQGISNRAGDKAEDTVADEFEEDLDELDEGADGAAEPKPPG